MTISHDVQDICVYCVAPITGMMMSDKGGMAHPWCFYRAHPFAPKQSFWEVLCGGDPVLMRNLVHHYMPEDLQAKIVEAYNTQAQADWRRRCAEDWT